VLKKSLLALTKNEKNGVQYDSNFGKSIDIFLINKSIVIGVKKTSSNSTQKIGTFPKARFIKLKI
jgi:hypothetical protein